MKKLEKRAFLCLALVAVLVAGLIFFVAKLEINGSYWATFYANTHIYTNGKLSVGAVYDRNGKRLLKNTSNGTKYNSDELIRRANLNATGDPGGNIATGANVAFRSKMVGYNFVTGTNGLLKSGGSRVYLTVDSKVSKAAYEALSGRNGLVGVYNYKTGEIICMVSTPTYDPGEKGENTLSDPLPGTYMNKLISATITPGSIFKLVTTAAAIENFEGLDSWSYKCTGSLTVGTGKITCPKVHGTVDSYGALANSCNCAYATLAMELGGDVLAEYADALGLTKAYNLDGINSAAGTFNFDSADVNVAWAGIGQFEDQLNPLSMMVYMGAIANDGKAALPTLLLDESLIKKGAKLMGKESENASAGSTRLLKSETAKELSDMMRNNVKITYGDGNYPNLSLHAKSGTAEVGSGKAPHSWFCGFAGDYAFIVCVENGGYGSSVAGPVANKVLQYMKTEGYNL